RCWFEVVAAENTNGIEGLEFWRITWRLQCFRKVEAFYRWPKIRVLQANDFRVTRRRLRKKVFIVLHNVSELHPFLVRIPTRAQNVALEINGVPVVRSNWKEMNFIAVLDFE